MKLRSPVRLHCSEGRCTDDAHSDLSQPTQMLLESPSGRYLHNGSNTHGHRIKKPRTSWQIIELERAHAVSHDGFEIDWSPLFGGVSHLWRRLRAGEVRHLRLGLSLD